MNECLTHSRKGILGAYPVKLGLAAIFLLSSIGTPLAQPSGAPSLGIASANELPVGLERKLGEAIMLQGRHDPDYIADPDVNQYLTSTGKKLAAYAPSGGLDIDVFGVRDPVVNAFAMPGGFIGINTGLIVSTQSESELAGVIAHEISHVTQRHIARGLTQQKQSGHIALASFAAALLAAMVPGGANAAVGIAAFGQAAALDQQLGFSRDAEQEADRTGFEMLRKAGFDPNGIVRMFAKMMNAASLNEGMRGGVYATTHPLSIQRMTDMQNRVQQLSTSTITSSADYWYVRAKARVLQALDAKALRAVTEQLQEEVRVSTGVQRSAAWFGLSLAATQTKDYPLAWQYLKSAQANVAISPYLQLQGIDLDLLQKNVSKALLAAQSGLKSWPDRLSFTLRVASALEQAGKDHELIEFTRAQLNRWPMQYPQLYQTLGKAQERLGQQVAARESMATFYQFTGALAAAMSQLQQARTLSSDFYEQSLIDVRVQKIRQMMSDERSLLERFKS